MTLKAPLSSQPPGTRPNVDLTQLLATRQLDELHFEGESDRIGSPNVYGGQLIAQALHAAYATVASAQHIASLQAYFIRPAAHQPIQYAVERINDGRSFSYRQVIASQDTREVFRMTAAFALDDPSQPQHLERHTATSTPQAIPNDLERLLQQAETLPPYLQKHALVDRGIDFRSLHPVEFLNPQPRPARNTIWMRSKTSLAQQPACMHRVLLGYASDYGLLPTANFPHALSFMKGELRMASIDHAMHFHRPFRFDEWLRFECESPTAYAGRALAKGTFYNAQGEMVASAVQQGLLMHGHNRPED